MENIKTHKQLKKKKKERKKEISLNQIPENSLIHFELTAFRLRVLMFIDKTISSSTYFRIKLLHVTDRLQTILLTIAFNEM
jgi:hypothetical protein